MNTRTILHSICIGALGALLSVPTFAQTTTAPTITTQPVSVVAAPGTNVVFSVVATGTAPLTYQWYKGDVAIPSATTTSLTLAAVTSTDAGTYTVRVSNAVNFVTSSPATLTLTPPPADAPVITAQPVSVTVAAGTNAVFSVVATGTAPLTYQWYKGDVAIPSATTTSLTLAAVTSTDAGTYTVRVSNAVNFVTSSPVTLTIAPPPANAPVITTQPVSVVAAAGTTAVFNVVATGTAPLSYQWYKGDVAIPSGTTTSLTLGGVTTTDAGTYTVRVSNSAGFVTSSPVTLTITPPPANAPVITTQPVSVTAAPGANAVFNVVATGTAPLSYQWYKGDVAIPSGTTTSLTLGGVTTTDAGTYTVRVSNTAGFVTSSPVTLTITPPPANAPVITTQPVSVTAAPGANAAFNVVATGTAPLSYQWFKGDVAIPSGTTADLSLGGVTSNDSGTYTVRVSNAVGSVTSSPVTLTVTPPPGNAPVITTQPVSIVAAAGTTAVFNVVATGTAPLTYQWFKGDVAIPFGTSTGLTLVAVTSNDVGTYTVRVSNAVGSVTSSPVTLTVTPPPANSPVITTQPVSQSVAAGTAFSLSVAATGAGPLTYNWYKEGRLVSIGNTPALTIAAATLVDAGAYRAVVTNAFGSAVSNTAVITVTGTTPTPPPGTAPTIISQPVALVVQSGAPAAFTIVASGAAPLRYQWFKNGREIEDAEAATFRLNAARLDDAAIYTVRVSNSGGQVTSAPASLTVNSGVTILSAPASQSVKAGANVTFTVGAAGSGLTYQWKFDGRTIKGASTATLSLPNVGALASGNYVVTIGSSGNSTAASAAALTVTTDARLVNIATRGHVGEDDDVLVSGFVTRGTGQKKILVRAVGPTLGTAFNVPGTLANPRITLINTSRGNPVVGTNAVWGGTGELAAAFTQVGAFPLAPTSADAALLATIENGAYTASVSAPRGERGVVLLEVYDADTGSPTAEITNISTRALVGAEAANVLIAGFVISGTTSDTVLVRGVGPSLGTLFGLRRALGASHVAVFDSSGREIAANSVWTKGGRGEADDDDDDDKKKDLEDASERAGAWKLPQGSNDSALLITLAPGVYTAHVSGVRNASGTALVEIFEIR